MVMPFYVEHDIGPPLVVAMQGDFLGDGEVVLFGVRPIDQVDGLRDRADLGLHLHAGVALILDKSDEIWYNKLRKCCPQGR